ncbi:MAG: hypothetical protein IJJ84_02495, partial [Kiritimatiellae bacterium]|nr:hypothetical protein [Kiritimatiellia bacterium]
FNDIAIAGKLVFKLAGGRLVANGDITVGGSGSPRNFGSSTGNIGTVEANGIYKNVTGNGRIDVYVTNMVVGAGGFGMKRIDYSFQMFVDSKLTAKDDLTIYEPVRTDANTPKDTDWGIHLNGKTFTVDTAEHTVTFDSHIHAAAGTIVKEGAGEMIMQNRQKKHTGGTVVKAGTLTVATSGAQGYGPLTIYGDATLANPIIVDHPYPLILNAGAILKPTQNTYFNVSGGTITLPSEGTVTVDMTDFTFVNGVANPILAGAAAGDEAKFTAVLPAGVNGSFSVAGGKLCFTATSGGSAAADLFWHPTGESIWSLAEPAWTNAAGEQVAFSPYANATVLDADTITLPADVEANDIAIAADGDVTLSGAGKISGPGTLLKTGSGTFTFNAQGGLYAQPIIVSNGVFKLGDNLSTRALGSSSDASPIIVETGATLDINYNVSTSNYDAVRASLTHDKLIKIAGDGVDGKGALVNNNKQTFFAFSDVELTDDATIGGTVRADFRHSAAYGSVRGTTKNTLTGPDKCLTVKNTAKLVLVGTTINLGSILVTDKGVLEFEGPAVQNIPGGIHLQNGTFSFYGGSGTANVVADSGTNYIRNNYNNNTATFSGTFSVLPGATLTHSAGNILYKTPSPTPLHISGGYAYIDGAAQASGWTVNGANASERVYLRQSGTYTGADITCAVLGVADASNTTVNATFLDSTLNVRELYLGWGHTFVNGGHLTLGEGTTLTTSKIAIGDTGTNRYDGVSSSFTVDGGTLNLTGTTFFVSYHSPCAEFVLNSGTVTAGTAAIQMHAHNVTNYAHLGGHSTSVFRQNGGTFNYGGAGFTSHEHEDNTEDGFIVLKGGAFNATANWSIPHYIPLCFKDGVAGGWTLNQADGTTATWTTALFGNGDVALNGAATLVGTNEVQGAVGGKWTVGDGFTAGLEGAASLL